MPVSIRPGSQVVTAEGDDLGTIRHLVVDPSRSEVTHVLVEKGIFFADDRLVPIEAIDRASDGKITLRSAIDPTALPKFDRRDYTPGDEATGAGPGFAPEELYLWRHPIVYGAPFPLYPVYPTEPPQQDPREASDTRARKTLAEREIVGGRTPVVSIEGEKVGTVDQVIVDDNSQLSHLVVDLGILSAEVVLPAHWIAEIDRDSVRLAVGGSALESLEPVT